MLGKLIKFDLKSTGRLLWLLFAGVLAAAVFLGINVRMTIGSAMVNTTNDEIPKGMIIFLVLFITLLMAMFTVVVVTIVSRFWRNLLGQQGYLMHTLPVSRAKLILSKLIVSVIWMLIAVGVSLLSFGLIMLISLSSQISLTAELWHRFWMVFPFSGSTVTLGIIMLIVDTIASILMVYLAMAIGQTANRHKVGMAVLSYIVITIILSILGTLFTSGTGLTMSSNLEIIFSSSTNPAIKGMDELLFNKMLIASIVQCAIESVIFFIGTERILSKRLNLE